MGYKPTKKLFRITFSQYEGLELNTVAPPMGELMDVADMRLNMNQAAERREQVFQIFAKRIKVWNLEHPEIETSGDEPDHPCKRCGLQEGDPMPTTAEAMMCLDLDFIMSLFFGWLATVSRVDPPNGMSLNVGGSNTQEDLMRQLADLQSPMPSQGLNTN